MFTNSLQYLFALATGQNATSYEVMIRLLWNLDRTNALMEMAYGGLTILSGMAVVMLVASKINNSFKVA